MKKNRRIFIVLGICIALGFVLAACDGRLSSVWFSLETVSMVLLTGCYFCSADVAENRFSSLSVCLFFSLIPTLIWTLVVRNDSYFGYSAGKIIGGALICGGIIFLCSLLTRHETGPLRAAFGRNLLPAFFGVAGVHRLISYFKDMKSFTLSAKDELCVHGILFVVLSIGVFIGANRSRLAKLDAYIALAALCGVFTVLHVIEQIHIPILDV